MTRLLAVSLLGLALLGGSASGADQRRLRVAFVTHVGNQPTSRIIDGGFLGFVRAARQLPIEAKVVYVDPREDGAAALVSVARQRYDLVVDGLPPPWGMVDRVARAYPRVKFLLPDGALSELPHRPGNVQGAFYRRSEAGYLAGYLAALVEDRRPGRHVISSVGGRPVWGVDPFLAGYRAGALRADPRMRVLTAYSQDFADPAKCRRVARSQVARGSGVLFNVAGNCGLGVLEEAKARHVWGIGVDVDQSYLGPHILTSAVLRIDEKVYERIRALVDGRFASGVTATYGVANGGVGLGRISPSVPRALVRRVERIRSLIAAGRIRVPSRLPAR